MSDENNALVQVIVNAAIQCDQAMKVDDDSDSENVSQFIHELQQSKDIPTTLNMLQAYLDDENNAAHARQLFSTLIQQLPPAEYVNDITAHNEKIIKTQRFTELEKRLLHYPRAAESNLATAADIIKRNIMFFLPSTDFGRMKAISKAFNTAHATSTEQWKIRLLEDFNLDTPIEKNGDILGKAGFTNADAAKQVFLKLHHLKHLARTDKNGDNRDFHQAFIFTQNPELWVLQLLNENFDSAKISFPEHEELLPTMLNVAAFVGNMKAVKYLMDIKKIQHDAYTLHLAIMSGNLEMVDYLVDKKKCQFDIDELKVALNYGQIEIVRKYIGTIPLGSGHFDAVIEKAMLSGNVEMVKLIYQHFKKDNPEIRFVPTQAIHSGSRELVKYLVEELKLKLPPQSLEWALHSGSQPLVEYIVSKQKPENLTSQMVDRLMRSGSLPLVNYCLNKFPSETTQNQVSLAIETGNLQIVRSLLDPMKYLGLRIIKSFLNDGALSIAVKSGNLDLVKYFIEELKLPFEKTESLIADAASSGNINLVNYMIDKTGVTPGDETLQKAVRSRNVNLVKYLVEVKNIPCTRDHLKLAIENRDFRSTVYIIEKGGVQADAALLEFAINNSIITCSNLNIVQYLIDKQHIQPTRDHLLAAADSIDIYNYLVERPTARNAI